MRPVAVSHRGTVCPCPGETPSHQVEVHATDDGSGQWWGNFGLEDECMNLLRLAAFWAPVHSTLMRSKWKFESQVKHVDFEPGEFLFTSPIHLSFAWRGGFRFLPDPIDDRR